MKSIESCEFSDMFVIHIYHSFGCRLGEHHYNEENRFMNWKRQMSPYINYFDDHMYYKFPGNNEDV